mgnify:CR=1 FL=1
METPNEIITVVKDTPPTISLLSPSDQSSFMAGTHFQIEVDAQDAEGLSHVEAYLTIAGDEYLLGFPD